MQTGEERRRELARCHGYRVVVRDGSLGEVETPLFPPGGGEPDYLLVRVESPARSRRPVVSAALIEEIDPERRLVYLAGTRREIARLPEDLPMTRGHGARTY